MLTRSLSVLLLLACASSPASAQLSLARDQARMLSLFKQVVAQASESTVRIRCDDRDAALGTIVSPKGLILTKASELRGKISCRLADGTEYDAEIQAIHRNSDLALLKIPVSGLKAVTFADSKSVSAGSWLAAAGPTSDPLAVGIVSVKTRNLTGIDAQHTLNSNRGFLNVLAVDADDLPGAKITDLIQDGAADRAGLKIGDVIIDINGKRIENQLALREALDEFRPGEKVTVKILRKNKEMTIDVRLDRDRNDLSRDAIQNRMGGELSGRRTGFPSILQTDMVLMPKDCGGPVVTLDGKIVGVSIARAGRVETWVLPSETIRSVLEDMVAGKYPASTVVK